VALPKPASSAEAVQDSGATEIAKAPRHGSGERLSGARSRAMMWGAGEAIASIYHFPIDGLPESCAGNVAPMRDDQEAGGCPVYRDFSEC